MYDENLLREKLGQMPSTDYGRLRDAYYKACEGMMALSEVLEEGGLEGDETLMSMHLDACNLQQQMNNRLGLLGKIL